jgi:predicted GNAT family acetyltransferase
VKLIRCGGPQEFLDRAKPLLLTDEACYNLLLGVPANLIARAVAPASPLYFAVVTDDDRVLAAAMVTPPHPLVLSRIRHPPAAEVIAQGLLAAKMMPPGVHGPVPVGEQFAGIWQGLTGQRHEQTMAQRIYRLQEVRPVAGVPGSLRRATATDRPLLIQWLRAFNAEAFGEHAPPFDPEELADRRLQGRTEGLHLWEHRGPRALAGYTGPTPHGIRVGPVYTPPEHRNQGYASACTAALSQLLLDQGYRFCFLYTDLANPTSNRIYQRIGYGTVCDVTVHRFYRS